MTEYECKYCLGFFKTNDWGEACMHYWQIHDEYISQGDLELGFLIDGHDKIQEFEAGIK